MKINFKELAKSIAIPLIVGAVSSFITNNAMEQFYKLNQPPLAPPSWAFPVVWTILYILMGISLYIVLQEDQEGQNEARRIFYLQLGVNFLWTIFFFNFGWLLFSFFWLLLLWVLIIIMIRHFWKVSKWAGLLNIPLLLWVTFAGYLNIAIWWLNR